MIKYHTLTSILSLVVLLANFISLNLVSSDSSANTNRNKPIADNIDESKFSPQTSSSAPSQHNHWLIKAKKGITNFHGIPAAFGDLNLDRRTDIVVINDKDSKQLDIYYQKEDEDFVNDGCFRFDKQIAQVYLAGVHTDEQFNVLVLLMDKHDSKTIYHLMGLSYSTIISSDCHCDYSKDSGVRYSSVKSDALNGHDLYSNTASLSIDRSLSNSTHILNRSSQSTTARMLQIRSNDKSEKEKSINCGLRDLGVKMTSQPLLFDLDGDLLVDIMATDEDGIVSVWSSKKNESKMFKDTNWSHIPSTYFDDPHSNSFIDINSDNVADLVFSSKGRIAYALADPDPDKNFRLLRPSKPLQADGHIYGQSTLVDIDANGKIDHLLPVCTTSFCSILLLDFKENEPYTVSETIYKKISSGNQTFILDNIILNEYTFPIYLRPADMDGDGFPDLLTVGRDLDNSTNTVLYLHNIQSVSKDKNSKPTRTFETKVQNKPQIQSLLTKDKRVTLAVPLDVNEDGKMDLLVAVESSKETSNENLNMENTALMNTEFIDAYFMKVIVTNGYVKHDDPTSSGESAIGPFVCFELNQSDDSNMMRGCAGQVAQSSHFALPLPYTIFGLSQTAHFVEKLTVTIPGFLNGKARTKEIKQIIPDAQIIIIPYDGMRDSPENWGYKLFLSPMSKLAVSTLIALSVICIVLLFLILILHRKELKEDAAEHEEYRRHWPESR